MKERYTTMRDMVFYVENTNGADEAYNKVMMGFPCFIDRENIEMNYSKISIKCRQDDAASIERIFAPFV